MALNYVTLLFAEQDAGDDAGTGVVSIAPTSVVTAAGIAEVSQVPVTRSLSGGTVSVELVATDNTGVSPAAGLWAYQITMPGQAPQPYLLPYANGASQRFDDLLPAVVSIVYGQQAGAVAYVPLDGAAMDGGLAPAVAALTVVSNAVAVNPVAANVFTLTLTSSLWTISNPGAAVGPMQVITIRLTQDGTGSRTVSWGSEYDWGKTSGTPNSAPTLTTTAGAADEFGFRWDPALSKWCSLGAAFPQGY